ncbi:MAG: hypothetical protein IPH18_11975 [Chitinophagaceae bacterium]|nr:hypothetical protein [Chitinophagaceae bacterium]
MAAQNKLSFDLRAIRQTRNKVNGLNISAFYHFSETLAGGLELNRFFPVFKKEEEQKELSAWDFDLNFHYILSLAGHLKWYPLTGISHTSETEKIKNEVAEDWTKEKIWFYNTDLGIIREKGHWAPHAEYSYTWGDINQQFFLAVLSYEIEWNHHNRHNSKT